MPPREIIDHYASIPNNVRALYATFEWRFFPFIRKEVKIEAWGQLCFDDAAAQATAYHMHNNKMNAWTYISWRCEMDGPCVGGAKLSGSAPQNFDIYDYVPRRYAQPTTTQG